MDAASLFVAHTPPAIPAQFHSQLTITTLKQPYVFCFSNLRISSRKFWIQQIKTRLMTITIFRIYSKTTRLTIRFGPMFMYTRFMI